ncbi:MAG TPA: AAA family ATPase [Candidatus Nanopelagicales bacterium]
MSTPSPLFRVWSPLEPPRWWLDPQGPELVGRGVESACIERLWESVLDGRRQALLVSGEPGVGKSRLVAAACRRLLDRGAAVLLGSCLPDAPVAYEPFREPIVSLAAAVEGRSPAAVALTRAQLGSLVRPDQAAREASNPGQESFEAVVAVLRAASLRRPVVLVLEDLHWATPSTLALLSWIIRRLPDARLLVLMTARLAPPDRSEVLASTVAGLAREPGVHRLALTGLGGDDVGLLLQAQTGLPPAALHRVAARLAAQTGGNPFLVQELCRDLLDGDILGGDLHAGGLDQASSDDEVHVPDVVRDLVTARLRTLPPALQHVVALAAVIGSRVPLPLLDAVADRTAVAPAVEAAVGLGLLVPEPGSSAVRFPHALARQAVIDATPRARRAACHGRVADVLELRSGRSLPELSELAHHTLHATGRAPRAKAYLEQCGVLADRSFAYLEASRHFERAAELADEAAERHRLQLLAAGCLQSAGDYGAARGLAAGIVAQSQDPAVRLAAATLMEQEATLLGGDLESLRTLTRALASAPCSLDDPACLVALGGLARALDQVAWSPAAPALSDAVLGHARRTRSDHVVERVLQTRLPLALGRADRARALLPDARELSGLARPSRRSDLLGASGFFRCLLGIRVGDPQEVAAGIADFELAEDLSGVMWFRYWPQAVDLALRFMRGDLVGAEALAWSLHRWLQEHHGPDELGHLGLQVLLVRREMGLLGATSAVVTGDEDAGATWSPGLLALYTELGMWGPAQRVLERVAAPEVLAANARTGYMATALGFMVDAALALHDEVVLQRLRPILAQHAGLVLVSEQFVAVSGTADRYLGMVDSALGQGDPIASFDAAEHLAQRAGFVVDRALTLAARAQHVAAAEAPSAPEVARCVAAARALAEPIGQRRVLRMLDHLPGPSGNPRGAPPRLTAREQDVLALLRVGASNRQIARALGISEYTAANHVRAILAKTGCANRTQAALLAPQPAGSGVRLSPSLPPVSPPRTRR